MNLYLNKGDYVTTDAGSLKIMSPSQAIIQQVMTQLTVKKGSFLYDKTLGSLLYKLKNYNYQDLQVSAYRYVFDSLSTIPNIKLADVFCTYLPKIDLIKVEIAIVIKEKNYKIEVQL